MAARFRRFCGYVLVIAISGLVTAGTVSARRRRLHRHQPPAATQDDPDRQRADNEIAQDYDPYRDAPKAPL